MSGQQKLSSTHHIMGIHTVHISTHSSLSESIPPHLLAVIMNDTPTTQYIKSLRLSLELPPNAYCGLLMYLLPLLHLHPPLFAICWTSHSYFICHFLCPCLCTHSHHCINYLPASSLLFCDSRSLSPHKDISYPPKMVCNVLMLPTHNVISIFTIHFLFNFPSPLSTLREQKPHVLHS